MDDPLPAPDAELAAHAAAELAPDEKVIWAGRPRADLVVRQAWVLVPFGLVFGGIALAFTVGAGFAFPPMMLCGLPFLAVGGWLVGSPAWLRRQAGKTLYVLTDRRAIVWEPSFFGSVTVRSYRAEGLGRMSRTERADGSGDLVFEEVTTVGHNNNGSSSTTTTRRGFLAVDDVRGVERLVRRTLLGEG